MTTALVTRELSRRRLEALLVAQALLDPPLARRLLDIVDPLCVTPACWQLLEGISVDGEDVCVPTKAALELGARVDALTIRDVRGIEAFSLPTLVDLINRLPHPPIRSTAADRALELGLTLSSGSSAA